MFFFHKHILWKICKKIGYLWNIDFQKSLYVFYLFSRTFLTAYVLFSFLWAQLPELNCMMMAWLKLTQGVQGAQKRSPAGLLFLFHAVWTVNINLGQTVVQQPLTLFFRTTHIKVSMRQQRVLAKNSTAKTAMVVNSNRGRITHSLRQRVWGLKIVILAHCSVFWLYTRLPSGGISVWCMHRWKVYLGLWSEIIDHGASWKFICNSWANRCHLFAKLLWPLFYVLHCQCPARPSLWL